MKHTFPSPLPFLNRWRYRSMLFIGALAVSIGICAVFRHNHPLAVSSDGFLSAGLVAAHEPRAAAPVTSCDFGPTAPSQIRSTRFEIANAGHADLYLSVFNKSCGCTRASIGSGTLAPGAKTYLEIEFEAPDHPGRVNHFVEVETNDRTAATVRFTFAATIEWAVEAYPSTVYTGALLPGREFSCDVELASASSTPFAVTSATTSDKWLVVALLDGEAPRRKFRITVKRPDVEGRFEGRVSFTTSAPQRPNLAVTVHGESVIRGSISPPQVVLGSRKAGSEAHVTFLARIGGAAPKATSMLVADPKWQLREWHQGTPSSGVLPLYATLVPPQTSGYSRTSLKVRLTGAGDEIEIPVSCLVQ